MCLTTYPFLHLFASQVKPRGAKKERPMLTEQQIHLYKMWQTAVSAVDNSVLAAADASSPPALTTAMDACVACSSRDATHA
eukprot:2436911-Karenia_brevis.AAC.1